MLVSFRQNVYRFQYKLSLNKNNALVILCLSTLLIIFSQYHQNMALRSETSLMSVIESIDICNLIIQNAEFHQIFIILCLILTIGLLLKILHILCEGKETHQFTEICIIIYHWIIFCPINFANVNYLCTSNSNEIIRSFASISIALNVILIGLIGYLFKVINIKHGLAQFGTFYPYNIYRIISCTALAISNCQQSAYQLYYINLACLLLLIFNYIMCLNKQQFFYNYFIDSSFQIIVLLQINMHFIYLYSNYSANNLFYQLLLFIIFLQLHYQIKQIVIVYYLKRIFIYTDQQRDKLPIRKIILIIEQLDGSQNNYLILKGLLLELKQAQIHSQFRKMKKQLLYILYSRYLQNSIEFAEYTFFKLKNLPKTLLILQNLKNTNQRIYNFKQQVNSFIEIESTSSYLSMYPFHEQMNNENIILQIIDNMTIICKLQMKYWKQVSLNTIVFEQLLNDYKRIQHHLSNCVVLFNSLKIPSIQRFQWHIFKLFFQLYFLNKKLKVRQYENFQSKQLNIEQIFVNEHFHEISSSEEIGVEQGNRLTSNNTAIILIDQNGRIINTNFTINEVVGYSRAELKGQYIENLMPLYFKNRHQNYLNQYLSTGIPGIMYKKQYIFYKDKFGAILRAKKFTKQYYNYEKNQFQFIAMLCPIFENNNFIIMNEEWEIMHQTQYFQSLLPMEQGLPLLTLCPKLLNVSKYKSLIKPEDLNFFNLRKSKDTINDKTIFMTMKSSIFGDPTSVVYKPKQLTEYAHNSPLQRMKTNQILDIFKQALLDDKDINTNEQWKSKKLNIRIPQNLHQLLRQYQKARQQLIYDFAYTGNIKVSVFTRNELGKKKINKNEFCRRFGLLIYDQNFLKFELIKSLYFDYCADPQLLDRVLKIDASVKFVQTNYHNEHYILLKIRRVEIYDEQKKSFTNQMIGVKKPRNSDPMMSSPTTGYYSEFTLIHTEREQNAKMLVEAEVLRGDFENSGLDHQISFESEMNIFIKDESNKASKKNPNIEFIKLINILYVSTQILMIFILFFACGFRYNSLTISNSIVLIKQLYNYNLYLIESYNILVNVELFNKGYLDQIVMNTPLTNFTSNQDFYDYNIQTIENCAYYNYVVFNDKYFLKMYYENFYGVTKESGLDVQIMYQVSLYLLNITDLQRVTNESRISIFYRDYVFDQFMDIVLNSFIGLFQTAEQNQTLSLDLFYIIIVLIISINVIYILITIKQNKKIFNNYLVIFRNISIIQKETKYNCLNYWQLRNYQVAYLKQFETHSFQLCSPDEELDSINKEENKQVTRTKFQFIYKPQGNRILFYCTLCTLFQLLMYGITFQQSISHQNETITFLQTNQFIKHNEKFWVLIALKEKYIFKNLYQTTVNIDKVSQVLSTFIIHNDEQYATNIPIMEQLFHSNLCSIINQEDLYCKTIMNSVLTQGMQFYDILLKNQAKVALNTEALFGENTLYGLYEFDTLNIYTTQAYRLAIDIWESNTQLFLNKHSNVSLICFLVQLVVQIGLILGMHYFYLKEHYRIYDVVIKYFRIFMPNISLTQEKRIRVELNRAGIIRR